MEQEPSKSAIQKRFGSLVRHDTLSPFDQIFLSEHSYFVRKDDKLVQKATSDAEFSRQYTIRNIHIIDLCSMFDIIVYAYQGDNKLYWIHEKQCYQRENAHQAAITVIYAFRPGIIATGAKDFTVRLWEVKENEIQPYKQMHILRQNISAISAIGSLDTLLVSGGIGSNKQKIIFWTGLGQSSPNNNHIASQLSERVYSIRGLKSSRKIIAACSERVHIYSVQDIQRAIRTNKKCIKGMTVQNSMGPTLHTMELDISSALLFHSQSISWVEVHNYDRVQTQWKQLEQNNDSSIIKVVKHCQGMVYIVSQQKNTKAQVISSMKLLIVK